jgi:hypothetical protein
MIRPTQGKWHCAATKWVWNDEDELVLMNDELKRESKKEDLICLISCQCLSSCPLALVPEVILWSASGAKWIGGTTLGRNVAKIETLGARKGCFPFIQQPSKHLLVISNGLESSFFSCQGWLLHFLLRTHTPNTRKERGRTSMSKKNVASREKGWECKSKPKWFEMQNKELEWITWLSSRLRKRKQYWSAVLLGRSRLRAFLSTARKHPWKKENSHLILHRCKELESWNSRLVSWIQQRQNQVCTNFVHHQLRAWLQLSSIRNLPQDLVGLIAQHRENERERESKRVRESERVRWNKMGEGNYNRQMHSQGDLSQKQSHQQ